MNIEDQLRNHFEDEAAGLEVPAGSFDDVRRRGRRRRIGAAAGGAALALVLVGGVGLGVRLATDSPGSGPTDTVAAAGETAPTEQARLDSTTAAGGGYEQGPGTPLGTVDFTWSEVATLIPEGSQGWINGMNANQWGVTVFGSVTNPEDGTTASLIWTSRDGQNWVSADQIPALGPNDYLNQLVAGPLGFVGLATGYDETTGQQTAQVLSSTDGRVWTASSLPTPAEAGTSFSPSVMAASDAGIVVSGSIMVDSDGPAVVVRKDGKTLTVDEKAGKLTIVDDTTGATLYSGTSEEIWSVPDGVDGLAVRDPATGDLLMTIPYEDWDRAMSDYLPAPSPDGAVVEVSPATTYAANSTEPAPAPSGIVVVVQDGKRLTLEQGRFRVEDAATGAVLAEGTENDLYRGPGPRFVDPATGALVLSITWDEYDQAQQDAYDGYDWPQPTPVVYFSADGTDWEQVFGGPAGTWINTVAAGPAGFLATGSTADGRTVVWRSVDGRSWEEAAASFAGSTPQWLGAVFSTRDGYLAQADDGIWSSTDGLTWTRVFTAGLYGDEAFSVNTLAAGPLGIVLSGSMYPYVAPEPMVVSKDGSTLTVDSLAGSVVITDSSGGVVFSESFDPAMSAAPSWIEETGDGGFKILGGDGAVIFEVTSADLKQAYGDTATSDAAGQPENLLVYSADGTTWNKVTGAELATSWVQSLGVTANGVLVLMQDNVASSDVGGFEYEGAAFGSATEPPSPGYPGTRLLIGTPAG